MQANYFWLKYIELGFVDKDTSDVHRITPYLTAGAEALRKFLVFRDFFCQLAIFMEAPASGEPKRTSKKGIK